MKTLLASLLITFLLTNMVAAQHNNNNQLFQQQIPGKQHLDLLKRMKFDHEVHNTARITSRPSKSL